MAGLDEDLLEIARLTLIKFPKGTQTDALIVTPKSGEFSDIDLEDIIGDLQNYEAREIEDRGKKLVIVDDTEALATLLKDLKDQGTSVGKQEGFKLSEQLKQALRDVGYGKSGGQGQSTGATR